MAPQEVKKIVDRFKEYSRLYYGEISISSLENKKYIKIEFERLLTMSLLMNNKVVALLKKKTLLAKIETALELTVLVSNYSCIFLNQKQKYKLNNKIIIKYLNNHFNSEKLKQQNNFAVSKKNPLVSQSKVLIGGQINFEDFQTSYLKIINNTILNLKKKIA
ncbi:hypothetical protein [Chryseobacterium sp.]|uniref:hypothetical protein n=1 Tax=Chryseobacterium sp. TaxID=1871047 RepID=UPI00321B90C0